MTKDIDNQLSEAGESRRNVLKAGVAVGVGTLAWSGPSITSLGGTPAYAAVCTQTATVILTIANTNTNMSCNPTGNTGFTYHTWQANFDNKFNPPTGYSVSSGFLGKCANVAQPITWTNPETVKCQLQFGIRNADKSNILSQGPIDDGVWPPESVSEGNPVVLKFTGGAGGGSAFLPTISKYQESKLDQAADFWVSASGFYSISLVCVPIAAQCYPDGIDF